MLWRDLFTRYRKTQKSAIHIEHAFRLILVPFGLQSLIRTLELIGELRDDQEAFDGIILGVIPFRDRWVGIRRTTESESNIESMRQITQQWFNEDLVLPSIRESEKFKQAINRGQTLYEMGQSDLAYPIEVLVDKIAALDRGAK